MDGSTQQRAILRSPTSHLKWEQKLAVQILKTVTINAFVGYRMYERKDLLNSAASFKSLEMYRNLLNKVQSTADFMFDCSQELLHYAATLELLQRSEEVGDVTDEDVGDIEVARLMSLAKGRKRKRLFFFNSEDGKRLRLAVQGHSPRQGHVHYCALCGQNTGAGSWRGHQTTYQCSHCATYLCVRKYQGFRKSCWDLWHSNKLLSLRNLPQPQGGARKENIADEETESRGDHEIKENLPAPPTEDPVAQRLRSSSG